MITSKKRASIKLPIDPEGFQPIKDAIKAQGKDVGFEALACLRERFLATSIRTVKLVRDSEDTDAKGNQS